MCSALLDKLVRNVHAARMRLGEFCSNRHGNVAVITALAMLPMIAGVGCAIDYTTATMVKTKLQAAADSAALATVSVNSSIITAAKAMSSGGSVTGGSTFITNFFNANLNNAPENTGYTSSSLTSSGSVQLSGTTVTATVTYSANVPTYFIGVLGSSYKNIAVNGTSTASYTLPAYIDFYLMLDVSGSMSFPSTASEQIRLQGVNPDNYTLYPNGCTFACHFTAQGACTQSEQGQKNSANNPGVGVKMSGSYIPNPSPGGYCQGFTVTRLGTTPATGSGPFLTNWGNTAVTSCSTPGTTSCIQLRADAVGYAVTSLLSTAASSEQVTNQFRVGLYPFIQNLYTYFALTQSLTATGGGSINNAASSLASLLDTGQNSSLGSGGTHFENALSSMNTLITSVGTGASSSSPLKYVFLVTDGSQNYQTQWSGGWSSQNYSYTSAVPYNNSATIMPPNTIDSTDYCNKMKKRGITVAVLYIPYQTIQNATTFANNEDYYANQNIPNIPSSLQSCASTNFFYTANSPTDITNALVTMFQQAVSTAHITN
jgi:Flp pilus assembly protein TadG